MSIINSYLWVQNKNYDGNTIVLKNDETASSTEVIEKLKSYYTDSGKTLNEINGFKLTLYRSLSKGIAAFILDGHLTEKDHENRYVPFSYLVECDGNLDSLQECVNTFPGKLKLSLEKVQKQVNNEKIMELLSDVNLENDIIKYIAAGTIIAGLATAIGVLKKNFPKKILVVAIVAVIMILVKLAIMNK